jgi:hypothetical protein
LASLPSTLSAFRFVTTVELVICMGPATYSAVPVPLAVALTAI